MAKYYKKEIINAENKRAIKEGVFADLTEEDFEWSIDWWIEHSIDEHGIKQNDGKLRDPYSGRIISSAVLEHIIPIYSGGGTSIINVLPSIKSINSQKNIKDPLLWWMNSDYYDEERMKNFIEYVFSSYERKLENGFFSNSSLINDLIEDEEDLLEDENYLVINDYKKSKAIEQFNKFNIEYSEFLATLLTIANRIDKEKVSYYESIIQKLENNKIFDSIDNCQKIQKYLFNYISNICPQKKYEIIRMIDYTKIINGIVVGDNIELNIKNRIDLFRELFIKLSDNISFKEVLVKCPNILCYDIGIFFEKHTIINKILPESNPTIFLINNSFLLDYSNDEINNIIQNIQKSLSFEYFEIFKRNNMSIKGDYDYLKYINDCKNPNNLKFNYTQKSNDYNQLGELSRNLNGNVVYNSFQEVFINNNTDKINNYLNPESSNNRNIIRTIFVSLYENYINNNRLFHDSELLNNIINEIIIKISQTNISSDFKGDNINEKKENINRCILSLLNKYDMSGYIILEYLRISKINELDKIDLYNRVMKFKSKMNAATSIEELQDIIKNDKENLKGIRPEGTFIGGITNKLIVIVSSTSEPNYISKDTVTFIIKELYEDYLKHDVYTNDQLKDKCLEILESNKEKLNLELNQNTKNYSREEIYQILKSKFLKIINNNTMLYMFELEKIRQDKIMTFKQNQREMKIFEEIIMKNKSHTDLELIINHIKNECDDIESLSFDKKIDGSLINWMNSNVDLKNLGFTSLSGTDFISSLIDKMKSFGENPKFIIQGGKSFGRKIFTEICTNLKESFDFSKEITNNLLMENVLLTINNIFDNYYKNEISFKLYDIKGDTIGEKKKNIIEIVKYFIENNDVKKYLKCEQIYSFKNEKCKIDLKARQTLDEFRNYIINSSYIDYNQILSYYEMNRYNINKYIGIKLFRKKYINTIIDNLIFELNSLNTGFDFRDIIYDMYNSYINNGSIKNDKYEYLEPNIKKILAEKEKIITNYFKVEKEYNLKLSNNNIFSDYYEERKKAI